ncbi:hypothetical protein FRC14_006853 [Serendipita sp. 396]|nr:hypothetical protein FRC14_006853 [Serendipita sp. 396]KAG8789184.1 hypothetical protein FRC15_010676 [Serendipita sp. 397]KAG8804328.1 hypothetical protein FRC16_009541 [Serendipita sp. 398]KAG8877812.1 hypothetical protein FRC20_010064 [Serendipita sp. 405]
MIDRDGTTGRANYVKLWVFAQLIRTFGMAGTNLLRAVGLFDAPEPPHEVVVIPSTKGDRTITINLYRNKAALELTSGPTAVHLNWHGSGWIMPLHGQNGSFIRSIVQSEELSQYPLTILDCSYALSPEHPCPADAEDARDAYEYVLAKKDKYDISKLTLSGFSAGGTLALGLSVTLAAELKAASNSEDSFEHPIKALATFYPLVTWLGEQPTIDAPPNPWKTPGRETPEFVKNVIAASHFFAPSVSSKISVEDDKERKMALVSQPRISPACARDEDFPPHLMIYTAEYDHLHVRTEELRERLEKAGKSRIYGKRVIGVGHGWDLETKPGWAGYEERTEAYNAVIRLIRDVCSGSNS